MRGTDYDTVGELLRIAEDADAVVTAVSSAMMTSRKPSVVSQ
ncbi:hypothetical protein [Streptomyces sp. NPDC001530]